MVIYVSGVYEGGKSWHYPQMVGHCGLWIFLQAHSLLVIVKCSTEMHCFRTALCCSIALALTPKIVDTTTSHLSDFVYFLDYVAAVFLSGLFSRGCYQPQICVNHLL